jgi:hypothetical protein
MEFDAEHGLDDEYAEYEQRLCDFHHFVDFWTISFASTSFTSEIGVDI